MARKISLVMILTILIPGIAFVLFNSLLSQRLWDFLVVDEPPRPVDLIIVLSGDTGRVKHAVALYTARYADKILLTGSGETKQMNKEAQQLGAKPDDISIDNTSLTTVDNARNSVKFMQDNGSKSAIVVTSAYHTRRSNIIFDNVAKGIDLTISAASYEADMPQGWWKSPTMLRNVTLEYAKLAFYYLFQRNS